ncbi:Protein phosphatase 1 regulatory subunit 3C [Penicillium rolfsii]|nr:Protein phosphatase 1 regulatory subunit 3C [Penicillium rolfsii]
MPYTAPGKSLLAVQHIENNSLPSDSRPERPTLARSASSNRLQNSRSYSSTSYVRRHRRSPSISKSAVLSSSEPSSPHSPTIDPHASLRQSPPPLNNAVIPPGALISPPESATNSSDEESSESKDDIKLEELEAAVRSIEQRRENSPERETMRSAEDSGNEAQSSSSLASTTFQNKPKPNHSRLSKESRKISHSRSSTETAVDFRREQALTSSPDDSDAEATPKPPMVRKKSGELVRPALRPATARRRPSSMPGTPVYAKAVHFDSQLEHIRHFLQLDRPLAVSAETSPVDSYDGENEFPFGHDTDKSAPSWEWELRLSNFPKDAPHHATHAVRLERLFLSADKKSLIGSVSVANLAFHKHVAARFTFDHWRTVSEVVAVYSHDTRRKHAHDGHDRFTFDIKLDDQANLESKTMFMCIRYNVEGQEHWDNNNGMNYHVEFVKASKPTACKPSGGNRPVLPRSRTFTGSHSSRPQSMTPSFDGLADSGKKAPFANPFTANAAPPLSRSTTNDIDTVGPPKRREKPHPQAFGNRYDFGASLTAAMRTKTPVDRTTLTARARSSETPEAPKAKPVEKDLAIRPGRISPVRNDARVEDLKPSSLVSSKPCHESSSYKELVDKYCFVSYPPGSFGGQPTNLTLQYGSPTTNSNEKPPNFANFTLSLKGDEKSKFFNTAAPSPPLSPRSQPSRELASESRPAPVAGSTHASPRASPTMAFRYPYQTRMQNGFMTDPQSSPVIRG